MADYAHELTDRELTALEKKIAAAYERAGESVKKRAEEYLKEIKPEADRLLKAMTDAADEKAYKAAKRKYQQFLRDQTIASKRFSDLQSKLVAELTKFNQQAATEIAQRMNGVFSLNHNFAAYTLEHDLGLNLQFTLYDERAFDKWLKSKNARVSKPKIDVKKDMRWNAQNVTSVIAKCVVTGMAIDEISESVKTVADKNKNSALVAAATFVLAAALAGRTDAHEYAQDIGIDMEKEWVATLDDKTRDEHRDLDGQVVPLDEPFEIDGIKIMEPRDENAPGYMIYNCRCDLAYHVKGVNGLDEKYRADNIDKAPIADMNYREWEAARNGKR
jgi:SPP1 gp7 family putative phage head morphogenesis protein